MWVGSREQPAVSSVSPARLSTPPQGSGWPARGQVGISKRFGHYSSTSMVPPQRRRLGVACITLVFTVSGGLTGFDARPLSMHCGNAGGGEGSAREQVSPHSASGHPSHPTPTSSSDCTCLGPCQSGVTPRLAASTPPGIGLGESERAHAVAVSVPLIRPDPTSYLFPLPNGPPTRS